jgi:ferredoxin
MLEILQRITMGDGREGDLDLLKSLAEDIKDTSLCGLGQTAPNPVLSTLRFFEDEYLAHILEKRCPAGVCARLVRYEIIPEKCIACTVCARVCPVDAVTGTPKKPPYFIHQDICIKCGACQAKCPFSAIAKE